MKCARFLWPAVVAIVLIFPPQTVDAGRLPWDTTVRRDVPLLAAGLSLTAVGHTLAERVPPVNRVLNDEAEVFIFDRNFIFPYCAGWGHVSDVALVSSVLAPLGAYLLVAGLDAGGDLSRLGLLQLETLSVVAGTMYITKAFTQRPRPYVYRDDAPTHLLRSPDSRASFFSGHAALAFAAAELQRQFVEAAEGPHWLAWAGYGVATLTACGRVLAGVHFPTDVLVGAAAGVVCAKAVLALHERTGESEGVSTLSVGMLRFTIAF